MSVLLRFVALYALMYAAFGVSSPFMPAFFKERGLTPEQLGLLFGAGTAIRLASGPLVGRLADLTQALRTARLLTRLQPAGVLIVAAAAGVVRWATMASSASVLALAVVQPLHGLTFAGLHLACMRLISAIVPQRLAASAQALYTFGAGASTAFLILVSGRLYGALNARGFLVMALLCAAVPPLAWRLYAVDARVSSGQR